VKLAAALKEAGLAASNSEANRKIQEGAVRVDGNRTVDKELRLVPGAEYVLQLGSRKFARVQVSPPD
jgi:tyrosyl-tRNA synthetase